MEKKSNRSLQPFQSKGDKKNQDSNNGKLWTKGGNRRESTSNSFSYKSESNRKTTPQHYKSFDKRPKPRGRTDGMVRDETSSLEQIEEAELGSVMRQGSKKLTLQMFNFTYPTRNEIQSSSNDRSYYRKNYCTTRNKYVKEHFLQANCQFIVNTSGDYKQYLTNPDALVEWNYIEQINVQVNEFPSCPICLHPPAAAKITRCGHIYCWSCILHYLSLSDKPQRKCPICYENIIKEDLKSVIVIPHYTFNIGDTITFKLMKRRENSLTPYPANEENIKENSLMNFNEQQPINIYCKLLLAQTSDINLIIERERKELQFQLINEEDSEKCFIEEAFVRLTERESLIVPSESYEKVAGTSVDELDECKSKYFYFYQACDGQHTYIHSINARMLKHTYGSLEFAPNTITAKILAKEDDSMTEEHRKHYKYLAHLPVTCSFETVEIELNQPIVSEETFLYFHDEIEKRKKKRARKAKEEKQREKRITEEENIKIYKKYPTTNIPLESEQQFPTFGSSLTTDFEDLSLNDHSGPSFAKMAASTKNSSNQWPNLKCTSSPIIPSTSTPKKLNDLSVISGRRRFNSNQSNDDHDSSDHEFIPETRSTFGDAIAQALEKVSVTESSNSKQKNKKKKSKKTLLSTSLSYNGN